MVLARHMCISPFFLSQNATRVNRRIKKKQRNWQLREQQQSSSSTTTTTTTTIFKKKKKLRSTTNKIHLSQQPKQNSYGQQILNITTIIEATTTNFNLKSQILFIEYPEPQKSKFTSSLSSQIQYTCLLLSQVKRRLSFSLS